jgi:hypothetical protein
MSLTLDFLPQMRTDKHRFIFIAVLSMVNLLLKPQNGFS